MALSGKLEAVWELKSGAEKFFGVWRKEPYQIPKHTPDLAKHVKPHEHDWDSHDHGSIRIWHFTADGKEESSKEMVEFDDENKTVIITGLEGHLMDSYKLYKVTLQVTPKGNSSLLKVVLEYEGRDETVPPPYTYFSISIKAMKDVDQGLTKA